jgi:Flp pilus assembly protein TadG
MHKQPQEASSEAGQSIVLVALVFIGLLAFVGLAVDAGLAFVRSSQFSSAVDAAALAGVVDLDPSSSLTNEADQRAKQFLAANGWPTDTIKIFKSNRSLTDGGIPQYTITVTWPVEFNFAKVIGLKELVITHPATAAYYAQAEILVPTANDDGRLRLASQYTVGRDGCTLAGDPIQPSRSSANPDMPNAHYIDFDGVYRYRIRVPKTYTPSTTLRVELFDPDSRNQDNGNSALVTHTQAASYTLGMTENLSCLSQGAGDSCVIRTGEALDGAYQNPFWFLRVDENWNSDCEFDFSHPDGDAVTVYELYYFDEDGNKVSLAKYTVDNDNYMNTDLKWVTPGVTANVPADDGTDFDVDLSNIPYSPVRGYRFVYLDVTSTGGSAKNVWDLRAGPHPSQYVTTTVPILNEDVNLRNLQIANSPPPYGTEGVFIEALGRMPTQYHVNDEVISMPLTPIDIALGASAVYVRHFDYGISAPPPQITFTLDSMGQDRFLIRSTIVASDPDTDYFQATCDNGSNCANSWSYPQFGMGIPSPDFSGGNLLATFTPYQDDFVWSSSVTSGRPILVK